MSDNYRQERRQQKRLPYTVTPINDLAAYRRERLAKEAKWEVAKADRHAVKMATIERLWDPTKGVYQAGEVVETDATKAYKRLKDVPVTSYSNNPTVYEPPTKWQLLKQKCHDIFMSLPFEKY